MKVQINQYETYEINYGKENLSINEFLIFVDRLDNIRRLLNKSQVFENENTYKTYPKKNINVEKRKYTKKEGVVYGSGNKNNKRVWCDTREKTIYVMQVFYSGGLELRSKLISKIGEDGGIMQKGFNGLKRRFNIQPQEVGLKRWLGKKEARNPTLKEQNKIPNFQIKEVDLFDKKEQEKYNSGTIHFNIDERYGCNQSVNVDENKLSKDWNKINCDNCKRKFENKDGTTSTS